MSKEYKEPFWKKIIDLTGTAIIVNLLFLAACLPVVTIGPAMCGLYSAVRFMIRGDRWFDGFKEGFIDKIWWKILFGVLFTVAGAWLLLNTISIAMYRVEGFVGPLIGSSLITALTLMISAGLVATAVYIPTGVTQWLRNGVSLATTAPLETLVAALFLWSSVIAFMLLPEILVIFALVFMTIYYPAGALITTILWKNKLIKLKKANAEFLNEPGSVSEEEEYDEQ